jgi:hypothetical protein
MRRQFRNRLRQLRRRALHRRRQLHR